MRNRAAMSRSAHLSGFIALLMATLMLPANADSQEDSRNDRLSRKPRVKSIYALDYWPLFRSENPRKAAAQLLHEADSAGVDIDVHPSLGSSTDLFVPSGHKVDRKEAAESLQRLVSGRDVSEAGTAVMCLVQTSEEPSVRQWSQLLATGSNVYFKMGMTYIVKVPVESYAHVRNMSFVKWIGEYKPEYKYTDLAQYSAHEHVNISSLAGDRPEFRKDLERLGVVEVKWYGEYFAVADPHQVRSIAELWWVGLISRALTADDFEEPKRIERGHWRRRHGHLSHFARWTADRWSGTAKRQGRGGRLALWQIT